MKPTLATAALVTASACALALGACTNQGLVASLGTTAIV